MGGPVHILLVEDEPTDVELTLLALREAQLVNPVHVASDGQQALDYVFGRHAYADRAANPLPQLILLDLKLPGVDGFEVLRQIAATPALAGICVVILTASREQGERALRTVAGASGYLVKPISFAEFTRALGTVGGFRLSLETEPATR